MKKKFTDRFKDQQPAVRTVEIPDNYPSQRILCTYNPPSISMVYTAQEAAAIESQYEKLVGIIEHGGPDVMKTAMSLVDLEDALVLRYRTIASYLAPHQVEEQAQQWRFETEQLAKKHVRDAAKTR